jgi:hypothetical protein
MKTADLTILIRDYGVIEVEIILSDTGGPQYQKVGDRGDLPEMCFHTTKGTLWLKGRDIVGLVFADAATKTQH